jgi:hypothetical protein
MRKRWLFILLIPLVVTACSVTYKFNGASIDYSRVKTISILDFPNQAPLVYAPLSQTFTESLKTYFSRQTKLRLERRDGDLQIEGEITGYELTPMATQSDGYAAETKLTITINVRFTNTTNPDNDFEQKFSAYRTFVSSKSLNTVQEELCNEINDEIADQIFNKAVANW